MVEKAQSSMGGDTKTMSEVPASIVQTGLTCLAVAMFMYVIDWIADQRERSSRRKDANNKT